MQTHDKKISRINFAYAKTLMLSVALAMVIACDSDEIPKLTTSSGEQLLQEEQETQDTVLQPDPVSEQTSTNTDTDTTTVDQNNSSADTPSGDGEQNTPTPLPNFERHLITVNNLSIAADSEPFITLQTDVSNGIALDWSQASLNATDYRVELFPMDLLSGTLQSTPLWQQTVETTNINIPYDVLNEFPVAIRISARFEENGSSRERSADHILIIPTDQDESRTIKLSQLPIMGRVGNNWGLSDYTITDLVAGQNYEITLSNITPLISGFSVEDASLFPLCSEHTDAETMSCLITGSNSSTSVRVFVEGVFEHGAHFQMSMSPAEILNNENRSISYPLEALFDGEVGTGESTYTINNLIIGQLYTFNLTSLSHPDVSFLLNNGSLSCELTRNNKCALIAESDNIQLIVNGSGTDSGAYYQISIEDNRPLRFPDDFPATLTQSKTLVNYRLLGLQGQGLYDVSFSSTSDISFTVSAGGQSCSSKTNCRINASDDGTLDIEVENGVGGNIEYTFNITSVTLAYVSQGNATLPYSLPLSNGNWSIAGSVDRTQSYYRAQGLSIGEWYRATLSETKNKNGETVQVYFGVGVNDDITTKPYYCLELLPNPGNKTCMFQAETADVDIFVFGDLTYGGAEFHLELAPLSEKVYTIETFPNGAADAQSTTDTVLELYETPGATTVLRANDDRNGDKFSTLSYPLTPGASYYLRVSGFDDTVSGGYSIRVSDTGPGGSSINIPDNGLGEPQNNRSNGAIDLLLDVSQDHYLDTKDEDWFRFEVPVGIGLP